MRIIVHLVHEGKVIGYTFLRYANPSCKSEGVKFVFDGTYSVEHPYTELQDGYEHYGFPDTCDFNSSLDVLPSPIPGSKDLIVNSSFTIAQLGRITKVVDKGFTFSESSVK